MARKVVSLYIDDSTIRLLVLRGKEILQWGEVHLEPGLVHGTEIIQSAEVAEKIKLLVRQCKVDTKRVVVGVSGLFCLSRPAIMPQLPKGMLDEAVKREAKRLLPIPPEQCYLSWQTIPGPADKTQIFMVGVPRRVADALARTLKEAGLQPFHLDVKPLALARIATEPNCVILDLQENELDIIIMSDGVPQPIRTVSLPDSALTEDEKLNSIKNDLDRTIKFYNANNPAKLIDSTVPLLVSGQLLNEPELYDDLSRATGMQVLPLQFAARSPTGFKKSLYMVNIGMAVRYSASLKDTGSAVAALNCLPPQFGPQPINMTRVLLIPASAIVLGLLALFMILVQTASADLATKRTELSNINRMVALRQSVQKDLTDNITRMDKTMAQADISLKVLTGARELLNQKRNTTNGDIVFGTEALPPEINLDHITYSADMMVIKGIAPDDIVLLDYAHTLEQSGRFDRIQVSSVKRLETKDEPVVYDFNISVHLRGAK